ncbi:MAG: peptidase domain-containing ABC transporter [Gammaproteobacteria bacterium]|nr:peptidase domain-containing ABC transporter [Gammaproteobacteria bacterium]MBT8110431.1 peptidase domain-containing ABC transporter [Gammaproteobacteria bacterium]NND46561.1 peptidase domain-containing ABC transporter [Woeseiaceae bacterium]NNL45131.1 peptidase domain-containing ABC transporter [Woeseiaceae bacterium]
MSGAPRLPIIRQTTVTECGLSCVAMVANYLGVGADLIALRRQHPPSLNGATLKQITEICDSLRLSTRAVSCRVSELRRLRTPCLLHWGFNHFVVLKSARRDHLVIHDPARGIVKEPHKIAKNEFTGVALEISRGPGFSKSRQLPRLKLGALLPVDVAIVRKLSAGLVLALVCELLVLASPFYLQIVIDQVLGKGDHLLLNTLVVGFAVLLLFQVVANAMRQLTFQYLSQVYVFDLTARVLHKMLRLPLVYFRSRDLGDVQHRVQSLRQVQDFIVYSAPALALDVLFIGLITALMALYDPQLTILAVATIATWCLWRSLLLPLRIRVSGAIALSESSIQTHFLETLRAVQTIKLANGESARQSEWRNLFAKGINEKIRAGNLLVLDSALNQLLFQGLRVISVYLLARRGLDGRMSIGMISAFVAYLGMFMTRGCAIVDRVIEYRLLEVPLNRLADIVFNAEEREGRRSGARTGSGHEIELRNVAFRYAPGEPWVLNNCSCNIPASSFTAIAGCSGTGKSTLLRIIAGAESIADGEALIGGIAVHDWRAQNLRKDVAAVFQEDGLLKGSVAENIAIFERRIDFGRVRQAAKNACVDSEIESLPMGYQTRIGDLGSSLSKGQIQRILLARAFYREPKVLLLDEATSGLDAVSEKRVIDSISQLDITRVVITHSDQVLQAAHEVLWLHKGTLLTSRPELNV